MDLIVIPQTLMFVYGGIVLSSGLVLGFVAGRQKRLRKIDRHPDPQAPIDRRVEVLELEVEELRRELDATLAEKDFMRELGKPRLHLSGPGDSRRQGAA
jgi:hypothetical protein